MQLHPYQLQSLSFMIEAEKMDGGWRQLLWRWLPAEPSQRQQHHSAADQQAQHQQLAVAERRRGVWWSPVLDRLSFNVPPAPWGGFLGEWCMGAHSSGHSCGCMPSSINRVATQRSNQVSICPQPVGSLSEVPAHPLLTYGRSWDYVNACTVLHGHVIMRAPPNRARNSCSCAWCAAEEMGLGKTVEVLGLVLSNPAPPLIIPGCLDPTTGKVLSRATLVVCAVSLVGQWCTEANSKLAGDLKIYPYHGSSRWVGWRHGCCWGWLGKLVLDTCCCGPPGPLNHLVRVVKTWTTCAHFCLHTHRACVLFVRTCCPCVGDGTMGRAATVYGSRAAACQTLVA